MTDLARQLLSMPGLSHLAERLAAEYRKNTSE